MRIYKEWLRKNWEQDCYFNVIETEEIFVLFLQWVKLKDYQRLVVEDFGKGKAFKLVLEDRRIEIYQRCGNLKLIDIIRVKELKVGLCDFLNCLYNYGFVKKVPN